MKKILTLAFSLLLLTSLTACQKVEDWENQKTKAAEEAAEEVNTETEKTTEETKTESETTKEEPKTEDTAKDDTTTEEPKTDATTTKPVTEPATEKPAAVQEVKTFNITAKQFEFTPNTISVNEGDKVVVNMTSQDTDHGFAITEYNISETVKAGETKTIEFTADKKGTFTFKCPVYCGEGHLGMIGNLIVN